jgi:hypothetical protein
MDVLGVDYFKTNILRAGRVFIDRHSLKNSLRRLAAPVGPRVLLVNGPRGSGKSYTSQFIFDLAANVPGHATVHIPLDSFPYGPRELVENIASQMGRSLDSIPIPTTTQAAFVRTLVLWLVSEIKRSSSTVWWFIFDNFQDVHLDAELHQLIFELVRQAETNLDQLRVVLLGYSDELPLPVRDFVLREDLQPLTRIDVEQFFEEFVAANRLTITEGQIQGIVDAVLQSVDKQLEESKDKEREHIYHLNRAVYNVVQSLSSS